MNIVGIIPARWNSTRFPGKPLALIAGKPLVQRVWEQCAKAKELDRLIIATDDERIADAAADFGAEVAMTRPDHPSGSDRLAEVAQGLEAEAVLNIQGDEPLIDPDLIDRLAATLRCNSTLEMVTAATVSADPAALDNPNVVKVVLAQNGDALYFSRSRIPYQRDLGASPVVYRHQGIYGYRRDFLLQFVRWPQSTLEKTEQLEQLRALENGARIRVLITEHEAQGVDSPEDVAIVERALGWSR
ncbi:MAG: 3-deoxy-manno-octulosonate cytidylyltransferase [Chthoniobacterales bacterium]